jgi:tRNA(Ile)-lysidine synthase
MSVEKKFQLEIQKIFPDKFPKKIAVAVSGGVDSTALLILLNKLFAKKTQIFCLTVDHNFRKDSAKDAKFVADFCKKNLISCAVLKSSSSNKFKVNIENSLRQIRYSLLNEFCINNQIENLFVAHHQSDLAENFLIRLFRGSGIDGLSAMDYKSCIEFGAVQIVRPLLNFTKDELQKYLQNNKVKWVEDKTNQDEKYLRNKIRKFLKELQDTNLINQRVALASKAILSARKILHKDMQKNASDILQFSEIGYFTLNLNNFKNLEEDIALRYLSWVLMDVSGNFYKPRLENLQKIYNLILQNKINKAHTFYGCILEKLSADKIIIYRERKAIVDFKTSSRLGLIWDNRFVINHNINCLAHTTLNIRELNQLIKTIPALKKLGLKNPLKKIFCTIPVLKISGKIIAIPHLNYYCDDDIKDKISIKFYPKTPLTNAN